jgi:hypothetical protein
MTDPLRLPEPEAAAKPVADSKPVIVKVTEPGYVPDGFTVRTRIDDMMFTADADPADVAAASADPNVESVEGARRLRQP